MLEYLCICCSETFVFCLEFTQDILGVILSTTKGHELG